MTYYWIRIGDGGTYERFDDLDAAIACLNECQVGKIDHWVDGAWGVGIDTPNFHGRDFVSLFVGDLRADLIRPLSGLERRKVEMALEAVHN